MCREQRPMLVLGAGLWLSDNKNIAVFVSAAVFSKIIKSQILRGPEHFDLPEVNILLWNCFLFIYRETQTYIYSSVYTIWKPQKEMFPAVWTHHLSEEPCFPKKKVQSFHWFGSTELMVAFPGGWKIWLTHSFLPLRHIYQFPVRATRKMATTTKTLIPPKS